MAHINSCQYCSHKFRFKFPYRNWENVAEHLYKRSVASLTRTESITFMYNNKPWTIEADCNQLHKVNEYLCIDLVEPMTCKKAREKGCGSWDYRWPDTSFSSDRDLKMLQDISKTDAKLDLDIDVYDVFGDGKHHHCGITKITGKEHIKIWLEEAWNHED